jgi:hypothetical protein
VCYYPLRNLLTSSKAQIETPREALYAPELPPLSGQSPGLIPAVRLVRTQRLVRWVLGLTWVYQGVVPKLLYPDTGELRMVQSLGVSPAAAHQVAVAAGIAEILFGLQFWVLPPGGLRVAYWLNIVGLLALGIGVMLSHPAVFVAPFNPFALNLSMMALAAVGLLTLPDELPNTSRNLRQPLP